MDSSRRVRFSAAAPAAAGGEHAPARAGSSFGFSGAAASNCFFSSFFARRRARTTLSSAAVAGGGGSGAGPSSFNPRANRNRGAAPRLLNALSAAALERMRRGGTPAAPARNDHHENWRIWMGGHDPASPMAEALINLHNHHVMWMIFIVTTVMWGLKSRI